MNMKDRKDIGYMIIISMVVIMYLVKPTYDIKRNYVVLDTPNGDTILLDSMNTTVIYEYNINWYKKVYPGKGTDGYYMELAKKESSYSNLGPLLKDINNDDVTAIKMARVKEYIDKYKDMAVIEQQLYGIPASITLAQALLESNVGQSKLADEGNNHFGIKCWGKCPDAMQMCDDSCNDKFHTYKNVLKSYRHHSKILLKDNYKVLFTYGTDYKKWAHGLKKCGYATDKQYGHKLIKIIEALKLYEYDRA